MWSHRLEDVSLVNNTIHCTPLALGKGDVKMFNSDTATRLYPFTSKTAKMEVSDRSVERLQDNVKTGRYRRQGRQARGRRERGD